MTSRGDMNVSQPAIAQGLGKAAAKLLWAGKFIYSMDARGQGVEHCQLNSK